MPIECDATGRKSPQQDRSHKLWREANGGAQCGKSARCGRLGGGWRRGVGRDPRATPARQPSTLLMSGDGKRGVGHRPQATAPILDCTQATFLFQAPECMRSPMILAFVRKTMSQKIVVTP